MSSNSKLWQTCVSKVIVFCVTPIVPESFMIVSSTNVLVQLFLMVGGFGGRSHGDMGFRGHGTEDIHTFGVRHGDMGFTVGDMGDMAT